MLLLALAAAAAASSAPSAPSAPLVRQATATVRIVSGATITPTKLPQDAQVNDARVRGADGSEKTVRIVEFQ
jgi:hypothetical protein